MKKYFNLLTALILLSITHTSLAMEKIIIEGTGDSQPLLRVLAERFEKVNPGTKIEVPDSIGSGGGIKNVSKGLCAIARVARTLTEDEKKYNLNYKEFGYSPIVFVANLKSGIDNLTKEQIVDIFSGKITSWSALGGKDSKIYIANREKTDSSWKIIEEQLPGIKALAGKVVYSTPEALNTITKYENTFGYLPMAFLPKNTGLNIFKVNGIYPSAENVQKGSYKFAAPLAFVWKGELSGLSKKFFDFVFSPEAQNLIKENGLISILK